MTTSRSLLVAIGQYPRGLRRIGQRHPAGYHQGRNNQLLARAPPPARVRLEIRRREHLGGLLNYYYREAA